DLAVNDVLHLALGKAVLRVGAIEGHFVEVGMAVNGVAGDRVLLQAAEVRSRQEARRLRLDGGGQLAQARGLPPQDREKQVHRRIREELAAVVGDGLRTELWGEQGGWNVALFQPLHRKPGPFSAGRARARSPGFPIPPKLPPKSHDVNSPNQVQEVKQSPA